MLKCLKKQTSVVGVEDSRPYDRPSPTRPMYKSLDQDKYGNHHIGSMMYQMNSLKRKMSNKIT